MAFNDYSISQTYDPLEEERKRREAELLAQQGPQVPQDLQMNTGFGEQAANVPSLPVSPDQFAQQQTGMQVAGPAQFAPQAQPAQQADVRRVDNQINQDAALAATRGITATPQAQATMAQTTVPFQQALTDSQNDQKKMWEIYNNSQYTGEQRQIAGAQLSDMMRQEYEKNKATQFIKSSTPEDLNKMLNARTTEGSWAKAIMYGLLGMENSAKDEAAKLGIGAKWQSQQITDPKTGETSNVLFKVRADGLPMEGYNAETGKALSSKELAGLAAGGQKLDLVGGTYVNDKTGEVGRVVSDKNTGQSWIQTSTGRKPMAGFRPQSSTGTLEDMRTRKIQEINLSLQGKTQEEKMRILRDTNILLTSQGYQPIQAHEIGLAAPQIGTGTTSTTTTTPAPAATTTTTPAPAATSTTVKPVKPSVPLDQQPTIAPKPSPFSTVGQTGGGTGIGGRPTGPQLEAEKTRLKEIAELEGQDYGKFKTNQGKAESNADYLLTKVDELTTHPGFETSVGAKGPSMAFGAFKTPVSGTDAADFAARFEEVQGQSFLAAIENLRGMGALSNTEGETATKAIKRMATTQSEKEFKTAAKDFQDIIKRGVDRARVKLGQEVKYGTPEASVKKAQGVLEEKTIDGVTYVLDAKGWKKK